MQEAPRAVQASVSAVTSGQSGRTSVYDIQHGRAVGGQHHVPEVDDHDARRAVGLRAAPRRPGRQPIRVNVWVSIQVTFEVRG